MTLDEINKKRLLKDLEPLNELEAELFEALANFMGLYNNPIARRRYAGDALYIETIMLGKEALNNAGEK